jgi:putative thioredoxin
VEIDLVTDGGNMAEQQGKREYYFDVTTETFAEKVLGQSETVPVVVDFWARWCGPCRALGPLLEDLADEFEGRFLLAKIDIDKEPALAEQFQVSSIPLVVGIVNGEVVSHFMGALPEPAVRQFIGKVVPSPSMKMTREALQAKDLSPEQIRRQLEEAVLLDPSNTLAAAHLAGMLLDAIGADASGWGRIKELIAPINEASEGWSKAQSVQARLRFGESASHLPSMEECQRRVASTPGDLQRLLDLARTQAARGLWKESLESYVKVAEADASLGTKEAREPMVEIFGILGQQHPLTNEYRHRLTSAIY